MSQIYTLHYAPDNASLIVRIALELIGAPYRAQLVDRSVQAQQSAQYLALNPLGMIPALETEDGVIFETGAILLWLADKHGALFPACGEPSRGDALKWLFFMSNSVHAGLRQMFYPAKFIAPEHASALRAGLAQRIRSDFAQIDTLIADTEMLCIGGPETSFLDLYACTCFRWAQLYPRDFTNDWVAAQEYPNLIALAQKLETLPAVQIVQSAEGLGATLFSNPSLPNPPIGSAT